MELITFTKIKQINDHLNNLNQLFDASPFSFRTLDEIPIPSNS